MSAVVVASMSEQEAQKLTERIRLTAHNYTEARAKLQELVAEAKEGNAHLALGYASWTAYLSEVLGEEPMRLARSERQEMVQLLSSEGMSTRAIAPIVGASQKTVARDVATESNDSVDAPAITGVNGKTYTRPEPSDEQWQGYADAMAGEQPKPKRRPVTDQAQDAAWEVLRAAEKLQRVINDDRFPKHRETISTHIKGNLNNALALLATIDKAL